ncbi:glycosyl transferase family 2 [Paraburkholderia phytofirmans OLGA172]|uniref:Glycosyl transferase family 2 n=1 Tax=Paraburkholderia phytofirmans OLGA172 TaxID=1417228 RepID=A0A160FRK5_9BURK|nr:glycosyltransferase family 2 protein [Paraburkholderia phytofirmans]ANB75645.1 glycosyl transferase family 2 [Paraburkholderia phytofirmans OLGA172]
MNTQGRLNVIIVNYGTPELTQACVASLLELEVALPEDVVVVDNASPDDSYARFRASLPAGIRLLRAACNRGFGSGVNFGMAACRRDYVLVVNPDTRFTENRLSAVLELLDTRTEAGLVGLDLQYPDGRRQYSARRFYSWLDILGRRTALGRMAPFRARLAHHLMVEAWGGDGAFDAEWVMGTGFVVRREMYEALGGMDEAYFLYMEDVDLCARTWQAGYRVLCMPGVTLVHLHQRQSAAGPMSGAGRHHLRSLLRFRRKFHVPFSLPPGISGISR